MRSKENCKSPILISEMEKYDQEDSVTKRKPVLSEGQKMEGVGKERFEDDSKFVSLEQTYQIPQQKKWVTVEWDTGWG